MRILYVLAVLILSCITVTAQITLEEYPLEFNPELQRLHHQTEKAKQKKLRRNFGDAMTQSATSRNLDLFCADDGIFNNGETVYVVSGDTVKICFDTIGFATFTNLSVDGNYGLTSVDSTCIIYIAYTGVILGLTDTIKVEGCTSEGDCARDSFPIVVKRPDTTYNEGFTNMGTEAETLLCVDPNDVDMPGGIFFSHFLDCHDPLMGSLSNGNEKDSCLIYSSKRFAGPDTVCFQISNAYCICDTYIFPVEIHGDTLGLPFMDDFSYEGPFTSRRWLDTRAFVNSRWTIEPPSVGFATMDGLDETGTPYGPPQDSADYLTSAYLDLDTFNSNHNVYLSFYYQPKGLGYVPNLSQGDSLVLQFKNEQNKWEIIDVYDALPSIPQDSVPPWQYRSYHVGFSQYFFKGFQFRFVNYAARLGIRDIWHIDYVRLDANEGTDSTFQDVAFTQIPNDMLKRYSNMPYRHFEGYEAEELIDFSNINFFSQFPETVIAFPSDMAIRELTNDIEVFYDPSLLIDPVSQNNVPPFDHRHFENPIDIYLDSFPLLTGDSLIFETQYTFDIPAQSLNPVLYPQVERNDTVRQTTYMTNFFSYDDGSAETAMRLGNATDWAIAVEFEANIDDSLRAIQVHFPHYNDNEQDGAKFNILIYAGIDSLDSYSVPVYEKLTVGIEYADTYYDTLQGYTTYNLTDEYDNPVAVFIPEGKFFIALQQASFQSTPVRIGLDKNTPEARPYQHILAFGQWQQLGNNGAAMVRAVVGDYFPGSTPVEELEEIEETIKVYPNPSSGILNFEIESGKYADYQVSVFNTMGQLIHQQNLDSPTIDLNNQINGIYFLKVNNIKTKVSSTHKVFIFK